MADTRTDKVCDRCGRPYSENAMSGIIKYQTRYTDASLEFAATV